jgi:hypothetical protein
MTADGSFQTARSVTPNKNIEANMIAARTSLAPSTDDIERTGLKVVVKRSDAIASVATAADNVVVGAAEHCRKWRPGMMKVLLFERVLFLRIGCAIL